MPDDGKVDDREHWGPSRIRGFYLAYWWKCELEKIFERTYGYPPPKFKITLAPVLYPIEVEADAPLLIAVDRSPAIEHAGEP